MKRFLRNIFFFAIPPLLLFITVETMISKMKTGLLSSTNLGKVFSDIGCEYQWVSKINNTHQVLIMGSSTVKYGLSCSMLNRLSNDSLHFINLAADSRDPIASWFLLNNMDLDNVKAVYFALDPWIFSKTYYGHRFGVYYFDLSLPATVKYFAEYDRKIFQQRYLFLAKYLFKYSTAPCTVIGQNVPEDFGSRQLKGRPLNFDGPVKNKFQLEKYGWSELQFDYFLKIDSLCKSRAIVFYTFMTPKRSDFCRSYKLECGEINDDFMKKLADRRLDAFVFGKLDLFSPKYDSVMFRDAYHLSALGQKVFSREFNKMLLTDTLTKFYAGYNWFKEN